MPRKADHTYTPKPGETTRHIDITSEERKQYNREWKEDRDAKQQIKDERFEAIRARRKKGTGGSGGNGINIKVETDKK